MQMVPLPTDGRVTVVVTAPVPPGPLRVALRVDAGDVVVEALGQRGPHRVGHLGAADAAAYRLVLTRLAARSCVGTCPARMIRTSGRSALVLHLGSPAACALRDGQREAVAPRPHTPSAVARTTRLRAAVPTVCATRPGTVPRQRVVAAASTPLRAGHGDRRPAEPVIPRPPLPARPPARFGQPADAAPRLTRDQRRRVVWATVAVAAALLLASALQHGASPDPAAACADGSATCRSAQP